MSGICPSLSLGLLVHPYADQVFEVEGLDLKLIFATQSPAGQVPFTFLASAFLPSLQLARLNRDGVAFMSILHQD